MSERTSRRAESPVTTIVSEGEAVKNHERTGEITDLEAQIAELQAIVDEKKAESRNAEAWGSGDQVITIDADGNRSDYEGYKEWRADHDSGLDDLSNFDENGNLKAELDSVDLTNLSLMQLVGEARKMNELGDLAGKQEVFDIIQDQLAERAVNEDWSEKELLFQLDRFEGLIGATENAESKSTSVESESASQPEATDSSAPVAETPKVAEPAVEGEPKDDETSSDDELNPAEHPAEDAVRDGESFEEYEERIGANREPVPLIGDSIEISDPLEFTANDAEEEQTPAEEAAELQDTHEAAPNTNRLTWRDALRNPGAYLATRMENYRLSHQRIDDDHTGERRGISDKNLKRLVGVVAGVVIAVSAYKLGNDIFGDHSALADAANNAAGNHPGGNIGGGDVAPTPAAPAPTVEGSGQNWNVPNYSEAARTVTAGEGFNQTFLEMNIPESEWPSLLQKVGPQLPDWAYRMPNGSWGISHTGTLPDSVLQLIENNR